MRVLQRLSKKPTRFLVTLASLLVAFVGTVDYVTGPEIAVSVLYLIPISLTAWLVGRRVGLIMSIASALCWLVADVMTAQESAHVVIPFWNATVTIGFFLVVNHVLSALQASKQQQEELTHFVIHDLRSPLTNVLAGLQALDGMKEDVLDETDREVLEMAAVSGKRMLMLVNSLLDLARLESGQMPLNQAEVSLEDLAQLSLQQVSLWAGQNDVRLTAKIAPEPTHIVADRWLTVRVLVNILSNAIKYSPPGSEITLSIAPAAKDAVVFTVADQGPGIPAEWVDKVFNKFTQIEARKAGSAVGSGLGLAFCQLAIQAQRGRIWMESELGEGTKVSFTLPITSHTPRATAQAVLEE